MFLSGFNRGRRLHLENWTKQKEKKSKATERSFSGNIERRFLIVEHLKRCGYNYNFEESGDCLHNSTRREPRSLIGQARKSARGMPWHQEPTKDVTSCDKLRGGANIRWSGDFRMGKPTRAILWYRALNQIGVRGERPELKHLSRGRKRHQKRFRK